MNQATELIVLIVVFLALAIPAYLIFGEHPEGSIAGPVEGDKLLSLMKIEGIATWDVTIMRRSGYVHDSWQYTGTAQGALQTALQKMRQARIYEFAVLNNSQSKLEVRAYYESTGARRTGKYIGGFIITTA